jgi:hypothetical protein
MRKILILFILLATPSCLLAQDLTVGKTREQIRHIIQSNRAFKLLPGKSCDTVVFQAGMQTVFYYKGNVCYSSKSILPVMYMNDVIQKMTTDSYIKIKDNVWTDAAKRIQVVVTMDKVNNKCIVVTTKIGDAPLRIN